MSGEARKTVTIVFADVTGSTGLGERLDPEALRHVMSRYFEEMKVAIERHGGTVEKFIGDAVMAVFGIPELHEDDALRAVRAAAEMRERLTALNEGLRTGWGVELEIRIGVNTGEVVAGDPAAGEAFATGDAVNVAARLEQTAEPGEILIAAATYGLVHDAVEVEEPEEFRLRGKEAPSSAVRLAAVLPDAPGRLRRLDIPMVGRERELALLLQAFERAVAERTCHLFTLLGPPGIGKSRLVREFVDRLGEDASIGQGRCLPYGEGITYWPVAEAVKELAGISDEQSPAEARERLSRLLEDDEDAGLVAEKLAAAVGLPGTTTSGEEVQWAVRRAFEILASTRPLVVVLDDIQWGEETFIDLVDYVADWSREAPILLVCVARPELLDDRPGWAGGKLNATSVLLEGLPRDQAAELAASLLAGGELSPSTRSRILDWAGGNPLFVEEMLAMLLEDGRLERQNGSWIVKEDAAALVVPASIQALLSARLDRLPLDERRAIEGGAVEGEVFHGEAVAALLDDSEGIRPRLLSLVRKELLRPAQPLLGEEGFRFRHLLIRDAAYAAIPKEVRADLHARFADWLERTVRERSAEYEEILGYHLEQAYRYRTELGPPDEAAAALAGRAASRLGAAGRRAAERGDMPAATNLLERAAGMLPAEDPRRSELELTLGWVLNQAGEFHRAAEVLDTVIAAAVSRGERRLELHARIERLKVAHVVHAEGSVDETFRLIEEAVPELEALGDDRGLAHAWRLAAYADLSLCRHGAASAALERGLVHAERAGDRGLRSEILAWLPSRIFRGPTPAEPALLRCRELLELAAGDRPAEAGALAGIALLEAICGRFDAARAAEERSRAIKEELGLGFTLAVGNMWRGEIELLAGDAAAAERAFRVAADFLEQRGETAFFSTTAAQLAEALLFQGRVDEAREAVLAAEETGASDDLFTIVAVNLVRGRLWTIEGRPAKAESAVRRAAEVALQMDDLSTQAQAFLALAEVVTDASERESSLEEALRLAEQKGHVVFAEQARRAIGA